MPLNTSAIPLSGLPLYRATYCIDNLAALPPVETISVLLFLPAVISRSYFSGRERCQRWRALQHARLHFRPRLRRVRFAAKGIYEIA